MCFANVPIVQLNIVQKQMPKLVLSMLRSTEMVRFECPSCGKVNAIHVNKIYTKSSKSIFILSILVFLIGIGFGGYYLMNQILEMKTVVGIVVVASILLAPSWVYSILQKEDRLRVNSFNRSYVKYLDFQEFIFFVVY